jgi:hypothetical protein
LTHRAKAPSAGSTQATGNSRGLFRRAFATRGALGRSKGTGAPSSCRTPVALLAALATATIAALALTAAPASAASAEMGTISEVSYTSAQVTGKITTSGAFNTGEYSFEYSTDGNNWATGFNEFYAGKPVNKEVKAKITVPKGGTKYFVRLTASALFEGSATSPEAAPYPSFTTLPVDPPTILGAVEASPVFSTSAKVSGKVKRPANDNSAFDVTACRFEYVTDADYTATGFAGAGKADCEGFAPITAPNGEQEVTAHLAGLSPNTTYHLRLAAENAAPGVVTKEAASTFTTLAPVAKPVVIAADDATEIGKRTAKATGEIERPAGADPALDVSCRFEFVTEEQFTDNPPGEEFAGAGQAPCAQNPVSSPAPDFPAVSADVSAELSGLTPNTTYHLRLVAENGGGADTKEAAATFTTVAIIPPSFTVDSITEVGYTGFRFTGTADPGNQGTFPIVGFTPAGKEEWIESQFAAPGFLEIPPNAPAKQVTASFPCYTTNNAGGPLCLESLKPGTTYQVRFGGREEEEFTFLFSPEPYPEFTTLGTNTPPSATLSVGAITGTTAHFSGTVDTKAPAGPLPEEAKPAYRTDWHIECVPECKDANGNLIGGTVEAEEGSKAISADAKRLEPGMHYEEVKLVAHNTLGTVETPIQSFDTLKIPPTVKQTPGASDGKGGYTLQGIVNPNNQTITGCEFKWGPNAPAYAFSAPCSPLPTGVNEKQRITARGQFRLSFDGQTTSDIPFGAQESVVQGELESLSSVGPSGVSEVTRTFEEDQFGQVYTYDVIFSGPLGNKNLPSLEAENEIVTTLTQGGANLPITVEAHLTGLNPDVTYHALLVVTYGAGSKAEGVDQEFFATLASPESCPANEQLRSENNSLALPECRAYEMVTPPGKEGFDAILETYYGGDRVRFSSGAGNIAKSGSAQFNGNQYVAERSAAGWETIPNLNGPSGSISDAPSNFKASGDLVPRAYSSDLLSSVWYNEKNGSPEINYYLRGPDGMFTLIGKGGLLGSSFVIGGTSDDLSHLFITSRLFGSTEGFQTPWGPGVYEFLGTGNEQPPRRVDVDNSASPISTCPYGATSASNSRDGRVALVRALGGCGGANPPTNEIWARVDGTTSINVSASQCERVDCNAPADAIFQAATPDGSRVFFTTKQQLLDGDSDEANDLYACEIPSGTPAPVGKANPCAALRQVSAGDPAGAVVESFGTISENGSTALFTAKGVLADNEDALKEQAVAGDHNLYVWRTDSAHPAGQTTFVGRLDSNDINPGTGGPQATPDGRYLVFTTASQLLDTDTDNARDLYRYDADTGQLTRASTNVFGVAGNGNGFDAASGGASDDGTKIVFTTSEALSPADGNAEPDAYLWTPNRVSLISTGSVGGGVSSGAVIRGVLATITGSGQDIYLQTTGALTPADGDDQVDVYDARIGGGFSFAQAVPCSGEKCQPDAVPASSNPLSPANTPNGDANLVPKTCPKGKVLKGKKCVKKNKHKKHSGKKHKRAGSNHGGGK